MANQGGSGKDAKRETGLPWRRAARIVAAILLIGAVGLSPAGDDRDAVNRAILGTKPGYGPASVGDVPNLAAIDRLIWMPGLDAGWDPQGLAFADGNLYVSAYRSDHFWRNRGPCRVFRLDPESGHQTGYVDIPPPCGHAGGLAYAGPGTLFVADTRTLFAVAPRTAFAGSAPVWRRLRLGRGVGGAFAASGQHSIWLGAYREGRPGRMLKYDVAALESLPNGAVLGADMATAALTISSYAQGAAIDRSGSIWVSRSEIGWGALERIDRTTGRIEARYPVPGGIEGIAFDAAGHLWAVSETGARHIPLRYPFFPLLFRLDPARLRGGE